MLAASARAAPWANVHRRGCDSRQGALLIAAGARLHGPEIAIVASAGMARVRVSSQPMLAVISTGNELVEPGEPVLDHQVRRSNAYAIVAALREHGFQRVADDHIRDDAGALRERLRFHLETHDVLVLSGGVSMGRFDLVPEVLQELGVRAVFHKVAQRPGKPLWFGVAPSGAMVFGLPGGRSRRWCASAATCCRRCSPSWTEPTAAGAPGARGTGALGAPLTHFLPVRIEQDDWGRPWAMPLPTNGSEHFTALAGTDGFVELPPGPNAYQKGFVTRLYRWS